VDDRLTPTGSAFAHIPTGTTTTTTRVADDDSEDRRGVTIGRESGVAFGRVLTLIISLNRPDNYTNVDGETAFAIEFEKVRGIVSREVTTTRTVVLKTSPEGSTWREDDHPATHGHLIKLKLESLRFTTQKELAENLGWKEPNLSRKVKQAIAAGVFAEEI
jgi:hypothetical protein